MNFAIGLNAAPSLRRMRSLPGEDGRCGRNARRHPRWPNVRSRFYDPESAPSGANPLLTSAFWVRKPLRKAVEPLGKILSIREKIGDFLLYSDEVIVVIRPLPLFL
jgi:hypothetical protein